jgi:high-affinity iron transporter
VLGIQPYPVTVEVVAYLVYLVPMLAYLLWPQRRAPRPSSATEPSPATAR